MAARLEALEQIHRFCVPEMAAESMNHFWQAVQNELRTHFMNQLLRTATVRYERQCYVLTWALKHPECWKDYRWN